MKKSLLTFGLSVSLIVSVGTVNLSAEEDKEKNDIPKVAEHTPYTVTRVSSATTLKKLAQRYYGDESDYTIIQEANKKLHMSIPSNTEVKIPITDKFTDQPEQLGWRK
jgi:nucleoid-associated protein YgaU